MNALVNIETITAEKLFAPGGVEEIISKLEADVRAMPTPDLTTEAGRDEIKSRAYKIARSKTGLDEIGKEHVAKLKKAAGEIDAERRVIRERLDALRDEVRKPVTDWEDSEKARIDAHQDALAQIRDAAELPLDPSSEVIQERLRWIGSIAQRDWQELAPQANAALAVSDDKLRAALAAAQKREADAAELVQLRAAQAERERQDREAAEAKQRAEREAREKAEAEERERQRAAQVERDKQAAADRAVEQERQRVAEEQARQAAAKAAEEAAEKKRQANKRHRDKIHREIVADLCRRGFSDIEATNIVSWLAEGTVPHVTITY